MGIKDLIVTPFFLVLFLVLAFWLRSKFTNARTKKYFISALLVKFLGAILLGLIYQFYYGGGDTFNFWQHGSRWIWKAFLDNPQDGLSLILIRGNEHIPRLFNYTQHIWYFGGSSAYFIVRLSAIFDLFTLHTYSATALFFGVLSFSGLWALFSVLSKKYSKRSPYLAIAILFCPSLVFWGSGILKDSIALGSIGWMTWTFINWFEFKKRSITVLLIFILSFWVLYEVKVYILLCFLPSLIVWLLIREIGKIRNAIKRVLIAPLLIGVFFLLGFLTINKIAGQDNVYSLNNIAERTRIAAYDIRYGWGARLGGKGGYDLGELDGTWIGMLKLMPAAINVSLFRPYIWEVRTSLMFLAAIESLLVLLFSVLVVIHRKKQLLQDSFVIFCLIFSLSFAFAVGVSTYNFGTLMRYKLPALLFYLILLAISLRRKGDNA